MRTDDHLPNQTWYSRDHFVLVHFPNDQHNIIHRYKSVSVNYTLLYYCYRGDCTHLDDFLGDFFSVAYGGALRGASLPKHTFDVLLLKILRSYTSILAKRKNTLPVNAICMYLYYIYIVQKCALLIDRYHTFRF